MVPSTTDKPTTWRTENQSSEHAEPLRVRSRFVVQTFCDSEQMTSQPEGTGLLPVCRQRDQVTVGCGQSPRVGLHRHLLVHLLPRLTPNSTASCQNRSSSALPLVRLPIGSHPHLAENPLANSAATQPGAAARSRSTAAAAT